MQTNLNKVGRPRRDQSMVTRFSVLFYMVAGIDDDLLVLLDGVKPRNRFSVLKSIIRAGMANGNRLVVDLVPGEDDDLIAQLSGSFAERASQAKRLMRTGIIDTVPVDEDAGIMDDLLDL